MIILAIETSCDDTSVAIIKTNEKNQTIEVLANLISSQINIHKKWGGVVPNLASRAHAKNLPIVFKNALKEAGITMKDVDSIALTVGPGLAPSLLIGVYFARTLAYKYNKLIIPINHVEGHIASNFLQKSEELKTENLKLKTSQSPISNLKIRSKPQVSIFKFHDIKFPVMNLIVSGGHTSLYLMKDHGDYELIGKTRDDAAGEAFDKAAKMLNLGYPGGPIVSALAGSYKPTSKSCNLTLPRPMINSKDFDFSFSGLKTALFYFLKKYSLEHKITPTIKREACHEFQQAVIDVLVSKTISAAKKYGAKTVAISGGVSANTELRRRMEIKAKENNLGILLPPKNMSTDNALMVAIAGYHNSDNKTTWDKIDANPNLKLTR